ncbi:hypothetical protein MMC31_000457 [Peltigera leucophlebia]|nr:hypothetical protein [Peltigera leucophlebia]
MNGRITCVTAMSTSFTFYTGPDTCETVSKTFSSINSVAQRYFDTSAVLEGLEEGLEKWFWAPAKDPPSNENFSVLYHLTLPTTFFHLPAWGVPTLEDNYGFNTTIEFLSQPSYFEKKLLTFGDHGSPEFEDFGYVPQALINYITQRSDITSRFPSGASFLPGGPSIIERPSLCIGLPAPAALDAAADMTVHGESTITNAGCFHPGACIHQDSTTVTITTIAPVESKRTPEPSATLGGAIAAETIFTFSTPSNFQENAPTPSSVAAPARLGGLIASAFGLPFKKTDGERSDNPSTNAKGSAIEPLAHGAQSQVLDGETVVSDSSPIIIISGKSYSVAPLASRISTNIVASALSAYETPRPTLPSIVRLGSQGLPANDASESDLDRPTLSPSANGASALLANGITSYQGAKPIVSGLLSFFVDARPLIPGANPITVSGTAYSLSREATALAVNGVQLIPGAEPIVVSGVTYSLAPKATALTIDGQTRSLFSGIEDDGTNSAGYAVDGTALVPGSEPITVSGTAYSLSTEATALAVNGVMLIPGSQPVVASGLTYNLAPKATALSINGETHILSPGAQDSTNPATYAVDGKPLVPGAKAITVSGITYSLAPKVTALTVNGNTLIPGGEPIVASGTTYSLAPQATAIVVNGVIKPLALGGLDGSEIPRLTGYVIANQTVVPGAPAITISGSSFSLTSKGNFLLVDNNTAIALPTPAPKPGSQISFYLHSNQLMTASATLISDSQASLVIKNTNDYYTTTTSIKGDPFTVSTTERLDRSSSITAILPSSTFPSAAANRRERLLSLGGGPLMISVLAGCMFFLIFGELGLGIRFT